MDNKSVKRNIVTVRKALKISQEEMAAKLGVSRLTYRNIESGNTKLINEKLDKIASIVNMSKEELLLGYNPSDNNNSILSEPDIPYNGNDQSFRLEYENEINRLKYALEAEQKLNESLQVVIKSKEEIIRLQEEIIKENK